LIHRRVRAGERVKDLREGGVGATTEVGEHAGTLVRAEILKDLLLIGGSSMLRNDTEELLRRSIRLNISGPSKELAAGSDELARLVVTPNGRPATLGCLHENRLVTLKTWDHEGIKNLIHRDLIVGSHDADGATNPEVKDLLRRVVGDIKIEMECSLLSTRLGELTSVVNLGRVDIVRRVRLNKSRRLNRGVDALIAGARNKVVVLGRRGRGS
jgi:hypothetical protein